MAQVAEHVLGKDEVTSSNLVSSSKKAKSFDLVFLSIIIQFFAHLVFAIKI